MHKKGSIYKLHMVSILRKWNGRYYSSYMGWQSRQSLALAQFLSAVLSLTAIHPIPVALRGLRFHFEILNELQK